MSPSIQIEPHHTIDALEFIYSGTKCAVYSRHLLVILLVKRGYPTQEIQSITALSANWIYEICAIMMVDWRC